MSGAMSSRSGAGEHTVETEWQGTITSANIGLAHDAVKGKKWLVSFHWYIILEPSCIIKEWRSVVIFVSKVVNMFLFFFRFKTCFPPPFVRFWRSVLYRILACVMSVLCLCAVQIVACSSLRSLRALGARAAGCTSPIANRKCKKGDRNERRYVYTGQWMESATDWALRINDCCHFADSKSSHARFADPVQPMPIDSKTKYSGFSIALVSRLPD